MCSGEVSVDVTGFQIYKADGSIDIEAMKRCEDAAQNIMDAFRLKEENRFPVNARRMIVDSIVQIMHEVLPR